MILEDHMIIWSSFVAKVVVVVKIMVLSHDLADQVIKWSCEFVWNPSMVNHTLFKFFGYKYGGSGDVTALVCYMILHLIL